MITSSHNTIANPLIQILYSRRMEIMKMSRRMRVNTESMNQMLIQCIHMHSMSTLLQREHSVRNSAAKSDKDLHVVEEETCVVQCLFLFQMDSIDSYLQFVWSEGFIRRKLKKLADNGLFVDCTIYADQTFMRVQYLLQAMIRRYSRNITICKQYWRKVENRSTPLKHSVVCI